MFYRYISLLTLPADKAIEKTLFKRKNVPVAKIVYAQLGGACLAV